jgi:hypothetical protein
MTNQEQRIDLLKEIIKIKDHRIADMEVALGELARPPSEALDAIWEAIFNALRAHSSEAARWIVDFEQDEAHAVAEAAFRASKAHFKGLLAPLEARVARLEQNSG